MNRPYEALAGLDHLPWPELNQRWLAQRFTVLARRLAPDDAAPEPDGTASWTAPQPASWPASFEPAHARLARLFGLSPFEAELLLLAAGAEIDSTLQAALAALQGTAGGPGVNVAVALARLPGAHWDALSPLAPLRHWQLLRVVGDAALAQAQLRIDERVLHHVTGVAAHEPRLQGVAQLRATHDAAPPAGDDARATAAAIADALAGDGRPLVLLQLPPQAAAQRAARALVSAALQQLPLHALWVDSGALDPDARALAEQALLLDREAALSGAAVVLAAPPQPGHDEREAGTAVVRLLGALRSPVVLIGALAPAELASLPERRAWRFALPPTPAPAARAPALRRALQQFRVDADTLDQALDGLPVGDDDAQARALWQRLRDASRGGLDALAQRIDSAATLADLVLPAAALDTLAGIAAQLRHRAQVHEDWGFARPGARGLGLAALFAGDSGTGKTFAAEAIASEAGLDLYRVDLALTVSKYIGETEKNLRRLFDAAESSGAVLLFDEADALFGKRSDVKDSHDRYANIEVAYLLQRMEAYRGLAILTTNLKSALDRAFLRRLRFVVNFPFPDEAAREALWRRQFPPQAPLAGDIDWRALAKLHLTGGHIRAVALNGAFRAAADGGAITQRHLIDAARAEYLKLERSFGAAAGSGGLT